MLGILQNDDLDGLKAFLSSGFTDHDLWKEITENSPKLLQHSPPLISVAAYYGSVKCTTYLIREGYDLFIADSVLFLFFFSLNFKFNFQFSILTKNILIIL